MNNRGSALRFALTAASLLVVPGQIVAANTNDFSLLQHLARLYVPDCRLRLDEAGKPQAIVSPAGELLDLTAAARENPAPTNTVIGYWFSPSMGFLARQKITAATPEQAVGVIQLLHAIWRGPAFVRQKLYQARRFDGGWVVELDHDFTNYPASVMAIMPYELLVDKAQRVVQLRERCYHYPGSAVVYTNTVISVYEREIKRDHGRNYPEALFKELHNAWEKEREAIKAGDAKKKDAPKKLRC